MNKPASHEKKLGAYSIAKQTDIITPMVHVKPSICLVDDTLK